MPRTIQIPVELWEAMLDYFVKDHRDPITEDRILDGIEAKLAAMARRQAYSRRFSPAPGDDVKAGKDKAPQGPPDSDL